MTHEEWQITESCDPFQKVATKRGKFKSETDMTNVIIEKLNDIDSVICQKIHGTAYGKPTLDIFGSNHGRFFWLEIKQPGKKPTSRQNLTMKTWIKKGAVASWTDSVEGAMSFISADWTTLTAQKMMEGFHVN